jgi:WD40 repeat protein
MRIIQSDNPRPLNLLAISSGGLVAAASDTFGVSGDVEVWDAASGVRRFLHPGGIGPTIGIAFSSDGRFLFVGEPYQILILDGTSEPRAHGLGAAVGVYGVGAAVARTRTVFSDDGTRFVTASADAIGGAGLEMWSIVTDPGYERSWGDGPHDFLWLWRAGERCSAPAISRDCGFVAAEERIEDVAGRPRGAIAVRDGGSGKQLVSIPTDPASPVQQLAFTADGSKLLVRTDDRTVRIFDAATGAPAGELVHPRRPYVTAIAVHPSGPVACARTDGPVTFWDAEKREQLRTLDWKVGKLVSVAFAPDGALAAAGTEDGKIVVWDVDL